MDNSSVALIQRHRRVKDLLTQELPNMQPPALKHEYLTAVANVKNNPIASQLVNERNKQTGLMETTKHIIGFADMERSLPLVLIQEYEPDGNGNSIDKSIRHAFPPNPRNPNDLKLIEKLQKNEDQFAKDHSFGEHVVEPRNIKQNLTDYDRMHINTHGLTDYVPRIRYTKDEYDDLRKTFYPTQLMPRDSHVDTNDFVVMDNPQHKDYKQITKNLSDDLNNLAEEENYSTKTWAYIEGTSLGLKRSVDERQKDHYFDENAYKSKNTLRIKELKTHLNRNSSNNTNFKNNETNSIVPRTVDLSGENQSKENRANAPKPIQKTFNKPRQVPNKQNDGLDFS